jgi:hypothetical protein
VTKPCFCCGGTDWQENKRGTGHRCSTCHPLTAAAPTPINKYLNAIASFRKSRHKILARMEQERKQVEA